MKLETRQNSITPKPKNDRLGGLAIVFNEVARLSERVLEKIEPGAFRKALLSNDILCLVDHDETKLLGRTKSKTLALREDTEGLHYDVLLPETGLGRDTLELANRGDIGGVSVGFFIVREVWQGNTRRVLEADLREISIISAFPAYTQTTVELRSARRELTNYLRWAVHV